LARTSPKFDLAGSEGSILFDTIEMQNN